MRIANDGTLKETIPLSPQTLPDHDKKYQSNHQSFVDESPQGLNNPQLLEVKVAMPRP